MRRYMEVTHTYVIGPIEEDDLGDSTLDSVVNSGVSMMEAHIQGMFEDRKEIRSDWKLMPVEYQPGEIRTQGQVPEKLENPYLSDEAKFAIEHDLDQGINFSRDIMGQNPGGPGHPWDQGLYIFPEGHPLREMEEHMRAKNDEKGLEMLQAKSPQLKQIESGDED